MAALPWLDRAVDRFAMWLEDRVSRPAAPYRPADGSPLACFEPLPAIDVGAGPPGPRWTVAGPGGSADPIRLHVTSPSAPRRGTAILVPPWKIRDARIVAGWSRLLASTGREVWLHVPPHHLERSRGLRSGEAFVSPDLQALRASLEQVVTEIRILVATARSASPVAVIGLSLGALAAALAATAPDAAAEVVLVAPPELHVSLSGTRIGERYRALAARAGTPMPPPDQLAAALAALSPAGRRPMARRVFLAAGENDLIVPPEAPLALASAWGVEPHLYRRGHLTLLFACRALRRDIAAFLAG